MNGAVKIIGFGLAALIAAGAYTGLRERAEQKRTLRDFLDSVATLRKQQQAQEAGLRARFNQINVDQYLQAARLASRDSIAGGRTEVARYRALLVERDRLAGSVLTQLHALMDALPKGPLREQVRHGEAGAEERNLQLQTSLDQAQTANADAVEAVFDWADSHHAIVHARGDGLVVDGQAPLSELKGLEARVSETGKTVDDLIHHVNTVQSDSTKELARLRNDLAR